MNYNRRSTRPDGLFYREQRKLRGSSRGGGRGALPISPVKLLAIIGAVLVVVYFIFFFHH